MNKPPVPLINVPTLLTLSRIALVPFIVALYMQDSLAARVGAAALFVFAGITDFLDGWLARRLNQVTRFGAFLDPVADKLMVAAVLIVIAGQHGSLWMTVPAVLIILREMAVSALREWMAELGHRAAVAVAFSGKVKTVVQIIALTVLLLIKPLHDVFNELVIEPQLVFAYFLLYVATGMTILSALKYLRAAWPYLRQSP
jgi:CDP-diacylglycerol--glycerol-3-phosphate 3-phosphatidyltransferase/cardiolipin synthase